MGFLSPWFLAGTLAIGLPLWLHLLRQHRSEPRPFSSLMFFERRIQSSIRHRRLRHLILLALRLALLLLLALAFAEPYIQRNAGASHEKRMAVIAVDRSFSMRYGDHLARAKQEAESALGSLRPDEPAEVIALTDHVEALTQPTSDMGELRAAIRSIQPGDGRSSYAELARFLRALSASSQMPLLVHLATDLQKSSMPPGFADLRLAPGTELVLHGVADKSEPNWVVENVIAPRVVYDPKKVRLQATIAGHGTQAAKPTVSLMLNGKTLATRTVDVPADGRANVEFLTLDCPYGFSRGEVRIDSADRLAEDDRFYFVVERSDPRKVLFLYQQPRDLTYYKAAIEATAEAAFQLESLPVDQAANVAFGKYVFVVLSDVGSLTSGMEDNLRRYVNGGGAVLVALGPASVASPKVPVLATSVSGSRYAARDAERFLVATNVDIAHPAVSRANRLDGVKFFQAARIDPADARVIARLSDESPLLLEKQMGEGRVMVFTSTFDNISNDFPLHASFVPFVEQTAYYLAGLETHSPDYPVGSYVDLRASGAKQGTAVEVLGPDGKRALSLEAAATAQNFLLGQEGFYELRRASGRHEMAAVHADRRESDLAMMPPETVDLWKNTGKGDDSGGGASNEGNAPKTRPWNLWPYFVLLLLIVALAESLFADRYLGVEADPEKRVEKEAA